MTDWYVARPIPIADLFKVQDCIGLFCGIVCLNPDKHIEFPLSGCVVYIAASATIGSFVRTSATDCVCVCV